MHGGEWERLRLPVANRYQSSENVVSVRSSAASAYIFHHHHHKHLLVFRKSNCFCIRLLRNKQFLSFWILKCVSDKTYYKYSPHLSPYWSFERLKQHYSYQTTGQNYRKFISIFKNLQTQPPQPALPFTFHLFSPVKGGKMMDRAPWRQGVDDRKMNECQKRAREMPKEEMGSFLIKIEWGM